MSSTIWVPQATNPCGRGTDVIVMSRPARVDMAIYRGDSGRFRVRINDIYGNPLDLTGSTFDCDIRKTPESEPPLATLEAALLDGETNVIEVILTTAVSATLPAGEAYWDLELTTATGEVNTILIGHVGIAQDVSR